MALKMIMRVVVMIRERRKRRSNYHRLTAEQVRQMEALFKESTHPDEKQMQQLGEQLDLHPRHVKFWFQNRQTQIKAMQERHERSLLKTKLEKLREEKKFLKKDIEKVCYCTNCYEEQLKLENARLKAQIEKIRELEELKSRIMKVVDKELEELKKMVNSGEPLWIKSVESSREILNYDEYIRQFPTENPTIGPKSKRSIEASRESRVVLLDLPRLIQIFMDVNQWKEMFSSLLSKAAVVDVICDGVGINRDGAVQLMYAELQMLTPIVATREVYFVRCCKQLSLKQWAIVDVSIDKLNDYIDASLIKCRKQPSGFIIEDKSNGRCKVTWVEHVEYEKSTVDSLYRTVVHGGLAFGAKHWMATLQLQCERLVFFMATNVPSKDLTVGVGTLAGRKSILQLAQRMTKSFCRTLGASTFNSYTKIATKTGENVRVAMRKNLNDPSEPIGVILCAVSSVWLPVAPNVLFDFLRDDAHRHEWNIMASGVQVKSIASLAKGPDQSNAVSIQTMKSEYNLNWVLQDSSINDYESVVVYAPVDVSGRQSVMTGCDSSNVAILPSGFSILPDGMESRPLVLTSRHEENSARGSLLTIALQVVTNSSPAAKLTAESVEPVKTIISCILGNIKTSLQCDEG